jgi:hypothetical protein
MVFSLVYSPIEETGLDYTPPEGSQYHQAEGEGLVIPLAKSYVEGGDVTALENQRVAVVRRV